MALIGLVAACRPDGDERDGTSGTVSQWAAIAYDNELGGIDSAVYHEFADSPIHWQPFGPKALRQARESNRLIFCVLARPQDPRFFELMGEMESDQVVVDTINRHYLPIMVDLDVSREFKLFARLLSVERRQPISFPFLIWMDFNARPYATTSRPLSKGMVSELFRQTEESVRAQWKQDLRDFMGNPFSGHVLRNNRVDYARRYERLVFLHQYTQLMENDWGVASAGLVKLLPEYDEYDHGFEKAGGILPSGMISLMARATMSENLLAPTRERSRKVLESLCPHLLKSPMLDPLDGGVFSYRAGRSWQLPAFSKNCMSQIEFAEALLLAHQAAAIPGALERALELINSIELNCKARGGLFALAPSVDGSAQKWTWSMDEVIDALGVQDAAWWFEMTGMKSLGNLTDELSGGDDLFRRNALAMIKSRDEMAASLSLSRQEFDARFEKARLTLLKIRNTRLGADAGSSPPHLASSFAMVSLYALAYDVTRDGRWLDKAVALHQTCRSHFIKDGVLLPMGINNGLIDSAPRAYHHALALRACIDLASVAPERVDAVATAVNHLQPLSKVYFHGGVILESDPAYNFTGLPLDNGQITFSPTTLGLLMHVEARAARAGVVVPEGLAAYLRKMPRMAEIHPMIHTDLIGAVLERHSLKNNRVSHDRR